MLTTTHRNAHRALKKAKQKVRKWKDEGRLPPEKALPFPRSPEDRQRLERIVEEADECEPYARYLAPYRLALQKHIH